MSGLAAGDLNRLILIEQRDPDALDALNQPINAWTAWDTRWANVKGQTGMAVIKNGASGVGTTINAYSFRIRYAADIPNTGMRINLDGMVFDIIDVRHDLAFHDWTDLICQVGGNDG